jgi:hypothetical protein
MPIHTTRPARPLHLARVFTAIACASTLGAAHAQQTAPTTAFDGAWFVALDCADTKDRQGLVKGYEYAFPLRIVNGQLDGTHGEEGRPAWLHMTGEVREGGVLEIYAQGISGATDFSVGRIASGSKYSYTMTGRLEGSRGAATRREVRPCTATFSRQPASR